MNEDEKDILGADKALILLEKHLIKVEKIFRKMQHAIEESMQEYRYCIRLDRNRRENIKEGFNSIDKRCEDRLHQFSSHCNALARKLEYKKNMGDTIGD